MTSIKAADFKMDLSRADNLKRVLLLTYIVLPVLYAWFERKQCWQLCLLKCQSASLLFRRVNAAAVRNR